MIAYLQGVIQFVDEDSCIIFVQGVGYKVYYMGCCAQVGDQVSWHIYDYIREDRRELFGAPDKSTLGLFQKFIDINGVGPRLVQKILGFSSPAHVQERILQEDIAFLTSIPGVGKKTAQKIILELKGVLVQEDEAPEQDMEVIDALVSLGYGRREAAEISKQLQGATIEEKIKYALTVIHRS